MATIGEVMNAALTKAHRATGRLNIAIGRRDVNPHTLVAIATDLREATEAIEKIAKIKSAAEVRGDRPWKRK